MGTKKGEGQPDIVELERPILALGAGMDTGDRTIVRDAPELGKRFRALKAAGVPGAREPRLFVAVTTGYDRSSGAYRYSLGDAVQSFDGAPEAWERITVPAGTYAVFPVRPLLGFLWAPAIGRTYARAYGTWLPVSGFRHAPNGVEHFERHDARASRSLRPMMEIWIPVRRAEP